MSDQPTRPAAASHVAASAIHPYPLSAHVPEVTTAYTVVCWPAILLHELMPASQKSPVSTGSQTAVPHSQLAGLAAVPSVVAQAGMGLHLLSSLDVTQKKPVADVQMLEAPQMQRPVKMAVAPSPWGQVGPVKAHKQAWEFKL